VFFRMFSLRTFFFSYVRVEHSWNSTIQRDLTRTTRWSTYSCRRRRVPGSYIPRVSADRSGVRRFGWEWTGGDWSLGPIRHGRQPVVVGWERERERGLFVSHARPPVHCGRGNPQCMGQYGSLNCPLLVRGSDFVSPAHATCS
jgi:hypothetical protein